MYQSLLTRSTLRMYTPIFHILPIDGAQGLLETSHKYCTSIARVLHEYCALLLGIAQYCIGAENAQVLHENCFAIRVGVKSH